MSTFSIDYGKNNSWPHLLSLPHWKYQIVEKLMSNKYTCKQGKTILSIIPSTSMWKIATV